MLKRPDVSSKYLLGCAAALVMFAPLVAVQAHPLRPFNSPGRAVKFDISATHAADVMQRSTPVAWQGYANRRRHMRSWRRRHGEPHFWPTGDGPAVTDV